MLKLFVLSVLLGLSAPGTSTFAARTSVACGATLARCGGHALTVAQRAWFRRAIDHILDGCRVTGARQGEQRPDGC